MDVDNLVMMANQIARAFAVEGEAKAIPATENHIRKYWDRRMKSAISSHVASGGEGLDPMALKALQHMAV